MLAQEGAREARGGAAGGPMTAASAAVTEAGSALLTPTKEPNV